MAVVATIKTEQGPLVLIRDADGDQWIGPPLLVKAAEALTEDENLRGPSGGDAVGDKAATFVRLWGGGATLESVVREDTPSEDELNREVY